MDIIEKGFDKIKEFSKTNLVSKIFGIFLIWIIALCPFYFYILLSLIFSPEGFWQIFVLFVFWCIVFGWLQVFTILLAIPATFFIIEEG